MSQNPGPIIGMSYDSQGGSSPIYMPLQQQAMQQLQRQPTTGTLPWCPKELLPGTVKLHQEQIQQMHAREIQKLQQDSQQQQIWQQQSVEIAAREDAMAMAQKAYEKLVTALVGAPAPCGPATLVKLADVMTGAANLIKQLERQKEHLKLVLDAERKNFVKDLDAARKSSPVGATPVSPVHVKIPEMQFNKEPVEVRPEAVVKKDSRTLQEKILDDWMRGPPLRK